MAERVASTASYLLVFALLIGLTGLTVATSFVELGRWHLLVAMSIAGIKATLVVLYFMHVLHGSRLIALVIVAALFWLGILFTLTFSDYLTRDWLRGASQEYQMKPGTSGKQP